MLVLDRRGDSFPDHDDPALRYRLPTGLEPVAGPDGTPQALVTRSDDGGQLLVRLAGTWELDDDERPVSFRGGRFRLRLHTPAGSDETGGWRDTTVVGDILVDRSLSLDPVETAIALRLGRQTQDLVDVEAVLEFQGLTPSLPWLIRAEAGELRPRIAALLGSAPTTWEEVENAFLGLTVDAFTWYPLAPAAIRPPDDQALTAIARSASHRLLVRAAEGWVLADDWPELIDVSLAVPQMRTGTATMSWSLSDFLASVDEPERHLVDVAVPAPFEAADLHVVNDVPLDPGGIGSIAVEVVTGGPTGTVRHEFTPGEPSAARLRFVLETFEELALRWRAHATVMTARGPAVVSTDFRPTGMMVEVDAASLRLTPLLFRALPEVFEHVERIEVELPNRTLELTAGTPQAWAIGRTPPASVALVAVVSTGERHPLGDFPLRGDGLTIDASVVGAEDTVEVALRRPAGLERRVVYLAVQIEGGPWRTLDEDEELRWPVRRENKLQAARMRYRCKVVPLNDDGSTLPMTESDWVVAVGDVVELEV